MAERNVADAPSLTTDVEWKMHRLSKMIALLVAMGVSGCATGPLRRVTLGEYSYATVEWTTRVHPAAKPVVAVGGVLADAAITAGDSVAVPIVALPMAVVGAVVGPCPESNDWSDPVRWIAVPVFAPFWLCVGYPASCWVLSYGWENVNKPGPRPK